MQEKLKGWHDCLCRSDAFLPFFFCIFIQVIRILLKVNMQQVPVIEEMKPSRQSHVQS